MKLAGWPLVGWMSAALVALFAGLLAVYGAGEEGVRVVVRNSARTSVLLFSAAFAASSLRVFWRNPTTKWLLANRRYVGVSFAVSHSLHLLALVALWQVSESFRADLSPITIVFGGLAYVFLFAMAATSFDGAVAALGARRWKRLHRTGMWYIWFIFAQSYVPRALMSAAYVPVALLLFATLGLRIAAWRRQKAPAAAARVAGTA